MAREGLGRTRQRLAGPGATPAQQCVPAPLEPRTCAEPFAAIAFHAAVDLDHLVVVATWSEPPRARLGWPASAVLSAYVFCCDGVVTSQFNETTIRDGSLSAQVSIRAGSIADECGVADAIAVRSFLHWREDGVDPPTLAGAAVFDAVFERRGGLHTLIETTRWSGLGDVCFPPAN